MNRRDFLRNMGLGIGMLVIPVSALGKETQEKIKEDFILDIYESSKIDGDDKFKLVADKMVKFMNEKLKKRIRRINNGRWNRFNIAFPVNENIFLEDVDLLYEKYGLPAIEQIIEKIKLLNKPISFISLEQNKNTINIYEAIYKNSILYYSHNYMIEKEMDVIRFDVGFLI